MVNTTNTNGIKQILLHHISLLDKGEARTILATSIPLQ